MQTEWDGDILVAGRGVSAMLTALALSSADFSVALGAGELELPEKPQNDDAMWQSVVALSPSAHAMLLRLGITPFLTHVPSPIWRMSLSVPHRRIDAANFAADPSGGQEPLAYVYSRADLAYACATLLFQTSAITRIGALEAWSKGIGQLSNTHAVVKAKLCVDALGHNSQLRDAAKIATNGKSYDQGAVICYLDLEAPHDHEAVQIFTPMGPLAILPLPGPRRAALVWSVPKAKAEALRRLDAGLFQQAILEMTGVEIVAIGKRAIQPLRYMLAEQFYDDDLVLIGESAHVVHPLAGQGLNLTIRDIAVFTHQVEKARDLGLPLTALLADFARDRRADAAAMLALTHVISKIFGNTNIAEAALATADSLSMRDPRIANLLLGQADHGLSQPAPLMQVQS